MSDSGSATREARIRFLAEDKTAGAIRDIGSRLADLERRGVSAGRRTATAFDGAGRSIAGLAGSFGAPLTAAAALLGAIKAVNDAAKETRQIGKLAFGMSPQEAKDLNSELERMARLTTVGADNLLKGYRSLRREVNVTNADAVKVLETIANVNLQTEADIESTSKLVGTLMRQMQLGPAEVERTMSRMVSRFGAGFADAVEAMPALTENMRIFGLTGEEHVTHVIALIEKMRGATGNAGKAAEQLTRLLQMAQGGQLEAIGLTAAQFQQWQDSGRNVLEEFGRYLNRFSERDMRGMMSQLDRRTRPVVLNFARSFRQVADNIDDVRDAGERLKAHASTLARDSLGNITNIKNNMGELSEAIGAMLTELGKLTGIRPFVTFGHTVESLIEDVEFLTQLLAAPSWSERWEMMKERGTEVQTRRDAAEAEASRTGRGYMDVWMEREFHRRRGIERGVPLPTARPSGAGDGTPPTEEEQREQTRKLEDIRRESERTRELLQRMSLGGEATVTDEGTFVGAGRSRMHVPGGGGGGALRRTSLGGGGGGSSVTPSTPSLGMGSTGSGGGAIPPSAGTSAVSPGATAGGAGTGGATGGGGGNAAAVWDAKTRGTPLEGQWGAVEQAARANGIPANMMGGVILHETGNGKNVSGNNPGGLMDPRTGMRTKQRFGSIGEGIAATGRTVAKNYNRAGGDIAKMGQTYAPVGAANDPRGLNKHWPGAVQRNMSALGGGTPPGGGQPAVGGTPYTGPRSTSDRPAPAGTPTSAAGETTVITTKSGAKFRVKSEFADNFRGFLNDYEAAGGRINPKSSGGLSGRPGNASYHPLGRAIDLNQTGRDVRSPGGLPEAQENALAKKWGLGSGALWRNRDAGHFEVNSAETARKATMGHPLLGKGPASIENVPRTAEGGRDVSGIVSRHNQLRERLERPIKMNIEGPTLPSQQVPQFRRSSAVQEHERETRDARWISTADIGAA